MQSLGRIVLHGFIGSACLLTVSMRAQETELRWDETTEQNLLANTGKRILVSPDSGVYTVGDGGTNGWLAHYTRTDGELLWQTNWDTVDVVVDLVQGPNGMLVVGWNSVATQPLALSAFDQEGNVLWTYHHSYPVGVFDELRDIAIDAAGNILVCATSTFPDGSQQIYSDVSVYKFSANGALLWRRTWNGVFNHFDKANAISTDALGNAFVAGSTITEGIADEDLLLLKYTPSGELDWMRSLNRNGAPGTAHADVAQHIQMAANGNAYVAGTTPHPGDINNIDFSVFAFSTNGEVMWEHHFDRAREREISDFELDGSGGMIVQGRSEGGSVNEWVYRLTMEGDLDWENIYSGSGLVRVSSFTQMDDGTIITTGAQGQYLAAYLYKAYVRAIDQQGNDLWNYAYLSGLENTHGIDVAVGFNNEVFVTGFVQDNSISSFNYGLTICLCPAPRTVCLEEPQLSTISANQDMVGVDLNGDGWRDIVAITTTNAISVQMGGPTGFVQAPNVSIPGVRMRLAAGDLDQDGDIDVVASGHLEQGGVYRLLNTGGTLSYSNTLSTTGGVVDVEISDLDGVNGPDILVFQRPAPTVRVFLNNGDGTFVGTNVAGIEFMFSTAVGDATGDGILDLLLNDGGTNDVQLLIGIGDGTFSAPIDLPMETGGGAADLAIGDFDQDGINDLVSVSGVTRWCVLPGLGGGSFGPVFSGYCGAAHDILVVPFTDHPNTHLLLGNAHSVQRVDYLGCQEEYRATTIASTLPGSNKLDVADYTNDGVLDLVALNGSGELRLWRGCDTLDITTSVPDRIVKAKANELVLFPSPTSGYIDVVRPDMLIGQAELSLWTIHGELLKKVKSLALVERLELTDLADGMYMVRFTGAQGTWSGRACVMQGRN